MKKRSFNRFSAVLAGFSAFVLFCCFTVPIVIAEDLSVSSVSAVTGSGQSSLDVNFSVSPTGGTEPYEYLWDFGDGSDSTDQNPSHTYSAPGAYAVMVTVTDADNNTASGSAAVSVQSDTAICSTHAVFDSATNILTIPYLDVPLIDPISQQQISDQYAVFSCTMKYVSNSGGSFSIKDVTYLENETSGDCHAAYTYDGTISIPNVDVVTVIALPWNNIISGPVMTYEVTLRQLMLNPSYYHVDAIGIVDNSDPATDDPVSDPDPDETIVDTRIVTGWDSARTVAYPGSSSGTVSLSDNNETLTIHGVASAINAGTPMMPNTGTYYWEHEINSVTEPYIGFGVAAAGKSDQDGYDYFDADTTMFAFTNKIIGTESTNGVFDPAINLTGRIGLLYDSGAATLSLYEDGVLRADADSIDISGMSGITEGLLPYINTGSSSIDITLTIITDPNDMKL